MAAGVVTRAGHSPFLVAIGRTSLRIRSACAVTQHGCVGLESMARFHVEHAGESAVGTGAPILIWRAAAALLLIVEGRAGY